MVRVSVESGNGEVHGIEVDYEGHHFKQEAIS